MNFSLLKGACRKTAFFHTLSNDKTDKSSQINIYFVYCCRKIWVE